MSKNIRDRIKDFFVRLKEKRGAFVETLNRRFKKESGSTFRTKIALAAISLFISVLIWSFVAWDGDIEGSKTVSVPIEYDNLPSGYILEKKTDAVQLRVTGRINALARLDIGEFRAQVDLNGLRAGEHRLPIKIDSPPFVRINNWSPTVADIEIYRQIERSVPVSWRIDGKIPDGMVIRSVETIPSQVMVRGPEIDVLGMQKLEAVIPSDKVDDSQEFSVPVTIAGADAETMERLQLAPSEVQVKVKLEEEILMEKIPVEVALTGLPAEGLEVAGVKITPETILINGRAASVRSMKSLVLPPVDITGLDQNIQLILPLQPVDKSPDVKIVGPDRARVDVTIRRKVTTKTYRDVIIGISGSADNSEWKLNPASATVTIEGGQAAINSLSSGQRPFELYVDVSNIVGSQLMLPVLVKNMKKDFKAVQIDPPHVTVTAVK